MNGASENARVFAAMEAWLADQQRLVEHLRTIDAEIIREASTIFASPEAVGRFLTSPAGPLGERTPVEVASTPEGVKEVLGFVRGVAYGHVM